MAWKTKLDIYSKYNLGDNLLLNTGGKYHTDFQSSI